MMMSLSCPLTTFSGKFEWLSRYLNFRLSLCFLVGWFGHKLNCDWLSVWWADCKRILWRMQQFWPCWLFMSSYWSFASVAIVVMLWSDRLSLLSINHSHIDNNTWSPWKRVIVAELAPRLRYYENFKVRVFLNSQRLNKTEIIIDYTNCEVLNGYNVGQHYTARPIRNERNVRTDQSRR